MTGPNMRPRQRSAAVSTCLLTILACALPRRTSAQAIAIVSPSNTVSAAFRWARADIVLLSA